MCRSREERVGDVTDRRAGGLWRIRLGCGATTVESVLRPLRSPPRHQGHGHGVLAKGERAVSFGQEGYQAFGAWLRAPTTTTLVAATAVRLGRKAFGATGVRKGWGSPPRKTGPELTVGDRARKFGDNCGRLCGT